MNPVLQALQSIFGQQKLISPLPQSESPGGINDPTQSGLNYYYQREAANQQQASKPQGTFDPKTIQYPAWLANNQAPQQKVLGAETDQQNPIMQAAIQLVQGKAQSAYAEGVPKNATPYEIKAAQIFDKYGVPPAIGLGIWAMEGRGKTINPNNPYNIGAYDSNPQNAKAYNFKDPLEGTEEAAKFLAGQSDFQDSRVRKIFQKAMSDFKKNKDQETFLKTIAPTYSSNPSYYKIITQTPEFQRWSYNN